MRLALLTHPLSFQLLDKSQVWKCGTDPQPPESEKVPVLPPLVYFVYFQALVSPFACFVDLRLNPPHKKKNEKRVINLGKQAQYLTNDHPAAARFSHLVHCLRIPQLVLIRHSPPTPLSALWHCRRTPLVATKSATSQIRHNQLCCFIADVAPKSWFFSWKKI